MHRVFQLRMENLSHSRLKMWIHPLEADSWLERFWLTDIESSA